MLARARTSDLRDLMEIPDSNGLQRVADVDDTSTVANRSATVR